MLILFATALWVLHGALRQFHYQQVVGQLRSISASQVQAAQGLTLLSYLAMTIYDRLAILYIRHPLKTGKVILASFVSCAFSNTIGLSLLTAGTLRYRLYSAWGLSAEEIARLVAFTVLTFSLGIVTIAGITFIAEPQALPALSRLSFLSTGPLGLLMLSLIGGYLLIVAFRHTPFRLRNGILLLPSLRPALTQVLVGSLDWALAGPGELSLPRTLLNIAALISGNLKGIITK